VLHASTISHFHKSPPLYHSILHIISPSMSRSHKWSFSSGFLLKLCSRLSRATCLNHLTLSQKPATCPNLSHNNNVHNLHHHPTSRKSILILSSHLLLCLLSGLFSSGLLTTTFHAPILSPIRATCRVHLITFNLITRITFGEDCRSRSPHTRVIRRTLLLRI
jgi:hypothetical protein